MCLLGEGERWGFMPSNIFEIAKELAKKLAMLQESWSE